MFQSQLRTNRVNSAFAMFRLMFHIASHQIRSRNGNAAVALILNFVQVIVMIGVLYFMNWLMGRGGMRIRGDLMVYFISAVGLFMMHVKTMGAVSGAAGPTSAMMKHGPMNTIVTIGGAALGALYMQTLTMLFLFTLYHCAVTPISFDQPVPSMGMMLLAWVSGIAIGLLFRAITPWAPGFMMIVSTVYRRANIISSGKMIVANMTPTHILAYFDWNPLFHIIDQGRGFIFLNYNPHYSNVSYPIKVTIACLMLGVIAERFTRSRQSLSWGAGR
jgi:ABC-type polysaccharide/polyol phosphate export permease